MNKYGNEALAALKEYLSLGYKVVDCHIHIECPDAESGHPPNVIVGFLCRHHSGLRGVATALNGEKIELLNNGRLREYKCPLHGNFELPSQRQKVECPTCTSLDGVNAYAATIPRDNHEELKRLKARAKPIVKAALKHYARHDLLSPARIAMINALVKRCFEPEENMHLLPIFPTREFIFGKWLVAHVRARDIPSSHQEYLMPLPQALVDAEGHNKTSLIDTAVVLCDSQWRMAHYMRHKEYVSSKAEANAS